MGKVSGYPNNASPSAAFEFLGTDPTNTSEGATGTTETVTLATLEALIGSVPGMQVVWMDAHGADRTGTTSVTSTFNTLLAAQSGNPCVFVFGVGTYKWGTAPSTLTTGQCVIGLGSRVTQFTWSGSGPLFLINMSTSGWNGSGNAGELRGFSIVGPFGSGGTAGIKYGAVQGLRLDDIGFYGVDGSCVIGYQVTSGTDWAEESIFTRLDISECGATSKSIFSFSTTSFDYTRIDAVVVVEPNIDIIALSSGALMQGLDLSLRGNLHGGTSNTGAVISMDRASSATASVIGGGHFAVSMECDDSSAGGSGNVGHYLLYMNSSSAASQFQAEGTFFAYNEGSCVSQGYYNPNTLPCGFSGWTNASNGTAPAQGDGHVITGGTGHNVAGTPSLTLATLGNVIYNQFADTWIVQLASGANAITFNALGAWGCSMKILLVNPASGTASMPTFSGATIYTPSGGWTLATGASKGTLIGVEWYGTANNFGTAYVIASGYTT